MSHWFLRSRAGGNWLAGLPPLDALFEPGMRHQIECFEAPAIDSEIFLKTLEALTDAQINHQSSLSVLTNGEQFYEAELECTRNAHHSINLEAYIFQRGEVASRFLRVLRGRGTGGRQGQSRHGCHRKLFDFEE